ncbi:MAG: hypothetical protein JWM64_2610 [Frankiales bacterium]|nr:hypothetical protein [Frankiales bacterium]
MILVTGATGNVGGALVAQLSRAGVPARALVRSPSRADDLRGYDVDLAIGSYEDPASLGAALDGVDRVFLVSPGSPVMADQELAVVAAVQAHAPEAHVVKLAAAGVDAPGGTGVRFLQLHRQVVQGLADSGLASTVLAPGSFMQNLLGQAGSVQEQSVVRAAVGDGAVSHVDVRDVAAVAAHVLTSDGHEGATYTITGPEALTYAQVAETLSRVLGREVRFEDVEPAQYRASLVSAGVPEWTVDGLLELGEVYRSGGAAGVTDEVQKATGSPARPLEQFLTEHRAAFA